MDHPLGEQGSAAAHDADQPLLDERQVLSQQPGVAGEGFQEINTVFLEDVIVPKENLVGEEGKGWTCAKYLLEFERGNAYSPALKHSLEHIRTIAGQESDGYGGTLLPS